VFTGSHEVKAGVEYQENRVDSKWRWRTPDGKDGWVTQDGDSLYWSSNFFYDADIGTRVPSVFLQDSWQATRRWRVNAGLRWDGYYSIDSGGNVAEKVVDGIQPRIGAVFQPGRLGSQKIFASYGRFYEQVPTFAGTFLSPFYQIQVFYEGSPNPITNYPVQGDTLFANTDFPADDLRGQHFDEFILGYERRVGRRWKVGLGGIHRELREAIEDAFVGPGQLQRGNPGRGPLDFLPDPIRRYSALELTLERVFDGRYHVAAAYVLSRNYGNYTGVYNTDANVANPNNGPAFNTVDQLENAEGLLPNDRPHVVKVHGSYVTRVGLGVGGFFTWQSGTPLSEFLAWPGFTALAEPRGSQGRTPSIWDLNVRLSYDLRALSGDDGRRRIRLLVDVFHLFSQKEPVTYDQQMNLYNAEFGQFYPNPRFMTPTAFQLPTAVRLGVEGWF
jgi:hypothetical protein